MEDLDAASASPLPAMADPGSSTLDPDGASLEAAIQAPITVGLGPVGPLLRKLHGQSRASDLLSAEAEWVPLLKDLCIWLKDMSEEEESSCLAQWWMKMARELCYDTDDHLDELIATGARAADSGLFSSVKDACERHRRFQLSPTKTIKPIDRWETSLELPLVTLPVHLDPPKNLVEMLALDDAENTLKVIPIHGRAGVGKTTAARALYHKYAGKFQYRAFVTVSRNPDMRGFLTSMLKQLKAQRPGRFPDVPDLIDAISKYLQGKRYFIVIDDIWTESVWNVIRLAFPRDDSCGRIITTTEIKDVALACSGYYSECIYKMEPLDDDESRKLFFSRVFSSEDDCPKHIKEVSDVIVRKCGGLPLAIVNIASLLANESKTVAEKWKHVHDSLSSTSVGMKNVLNLMYNSLPSRLRTFLLYLSMYAQGYVIKKDELVKHWVAEGFLRAVEGQDILEIAEGYFDELVSRGMVQAVNTSYNGEVLSCSVHQIVLDFIRCKSREENFAITVDYNQSTLELPEKVRRLSVQFGGVKGACMPESIVTSHVRSLIFWGFFKCVPCFSDFGLLRVLIFHIWADRDKSFDLTTIGKLFQLKYLKIECNVTVKLPGKIRRLQFLETLQVDARLSAVPSDIILLQRMLYLSLPSEAALPSGIRGMTSLRTLGYFDLSSNPADNVMDLGNLTDLQDLHLTCSRLHTENLENNLIKLGLILGKLISLKCLTLAPALSHVNTLNDAGGSSMGICFDGFSIVSPPPALQRLELSRHCSLFSGLPEWIGYLVNLCILKIGISRLSREDIDVLKGLPVLSALTLYIQTAPADRIVINKEGFEVLTYFKFMCAAPCLSFLPGAMRKVQEIKLGFNSNEWAANTFETVGFRKLAGLRMVSIKFGVGGAEEFSVNNAESKLIAAICNHPNSPTIRIQSADVISGGVEEKSTATEEREEKLHEIRDCRIQQADVTFEEEEENSIATQGREEKLQEIRDCVDRSMEFAVALFDAVASVALSKLITVSEKLSNSMPERRVAQIIEELQFIRVEFYLIKNLYTGKRPPEHASFLREACTALLTALAYDIEDCIDSFDANQLTLQDFAYEIGVLKVRSINMNKQIQENLGIARVVMGTTAREAAVVVPRELQDLLGDLRRQVWPAKILNCLLYLCLFPPDYDVGTKPLMRRWMAEGLVQGEKDAAENLEFLIQAGIISSTQTGNNGDVVETCRATREMHACISQMSKDFVLVSDGATNNNNLNRVDDARRLSVYPHASLPHNLPRLRTLAVFSAEAVLEFSGYRVLRVLDLKERGPLSEQHLNDILVNHSQVLMKYLSLHLGNIDRIPRAIGYLNQLETLDLSGNTTVTVYKEVLLLPKLKHLLGKFQLSRSDMLFESALRRFLREKSLLETLAGFVTSDRYGFPDLMSHMMSLRKVKIWCESGATQKRLLILSSAIAKFIRETMVVLCGWSLSIDFTECSREFVNGIKAVSGTLEALQLRGRLSQFPPFVAGLRAIEELCLFSTGLSWEVIRVGLCNVRELKYLKLIEDNLGPFDMPSDAEHLKPIERIWVMCKQRLEIAVTAVPLRNLVSLHILCQDLHHIPGTSGIQIKGMTKLKQVALHRQVHLTIRSPLELAAKGHPNTPQVSFIEYPQ